MTRETGEEPGKRTGPPSTDEIRDALRVVVDPELGDDIVALGMVGEIEVSPDGTVVVEVALTTAACPLRHQIKADLETRVGDLDGVSSVEMRTGIMDAAAKRDLMDRARHRAQERAVTIDIPPGARVLAVSSGKGGVGKSSVTVNLAASLARRGLTVGLLDADIWGFSVPRLLGMSGPLEAVSSRIVPAERAVGDGLLKVVSMGFLAEEDSAIMWRGLVLTRALQQFLEDVAWGYVDYLLVDMPPGTGDIQMGLARMLPRTEVLVVTTPPIAAQMVAMRAADMARRGHLRIAGVIENMSSFTCRHGETYALLGEGGGQRLASTIGVPLIGRVPFHPDLAAAGDAGEPVVLGTGPLAEVFEALGTRLYEDISPLLEVSSCSTRLLDTVERALTQR